MTGDPIGQFLQDVAARLEHGAAEYGDQSFAKPVAQTEREIVAEAVDQVGWCYILWCQAARKTDLSRRQDVLRGEWLQRIEARLRRRDRSSPFPPNTASPAAVMVELEVLALDLFERHQDLVRRLHPLVRAIEVAAAMPAPYVPRGRRGGGGDRMSSGS